MRLSGHNIDIAYNENVTRLIRMKDCNYLVTLAPTNEDLNIAANNFLISKV